jgi:hypothetical protein
MSSIIKSIKEKTKYLIDKMQEYSTNFAIKRTGSVKGNRNEKNRSGQSYLYKRFGMESEVFEIQMKDRIYGAELQRAVTVSLQRYPYLSARLVQKDGDFYFVKNYDPVIMKKTKKLRRLGSRRTNRHLIDVTFNGKQLFISFHHALVDGEGIKPFVETLLLYYCSYRYGKRVKKSEGIRMANEPLLVGETQDPFLHPYLFHEKDLPKPERNGFELPESIKSAGKHDYRYELLIKHGDFLAFAKKYHGTPSIAVALVMGQAIKNLYPDFDKPVICNSALSMRHALGCENTFKNCVKSIMFPYTQELSAKPLDEQAAEFRSLLSAQRDTDYLKKSANEIIGLYDKLDQLPTYAEKQKIMSFFDDMLVHTYFLSYIGQFNLGNHGNHIESIHLYNSGVTGLGINVIATDKYFCICFKQSFRTGKYVDEFVNVLKKYGIECMKSKSIAFLTPVDALIKRNCQK